jgi:hypothetical protein
MNRLQGAMNGGKSGSTRLTDFPFGEGAEPEALTAVESRAFGRDGPVVLWHLSPRGQTWNLNNSTSPSLTT